MGYIHVYTGNGKGKTTAAFGVALRAAMAGMNVYIGQFVKSMAYNETKIAALTDRITIEQLGLGCRLITKPDENDIAAAKAALDKCAEILKSDTYDMVILDELTIAIYLKLIDEKDVHQALDARNPNIEVIITGRYASQALIDRADLVTDMQEIKHYYTRGVEARDGIER
jgi:cob(I)alamin adenosyltransferase